MTTPDSTGNPPAGAPQRTPLYQSHLDAGGKLVDFAGWEMPVNYGSQIEEHHAVRQHAGMFDVSHMTIVDITGEGSSAYLSRLLANDIARAEPVGKAIYSCMLNESGGIVDDLIAYAQPGGHYRLVVNAGTREKDMAWMQQHKPGNVTISERPELAMIAVQGPEAVAKVLPLLDPAKRDAVSGMPRFFAQHCGNRFVARTGYTGEDGFEIALPATDAVTLWAELLAAGVKPCGLGARDTLRLEAGMNLYGSDMDESVTPLETGLNWTIGWEPATRDFIGRAALEKQKEAGVAHTMRGLVLQGRGVLRGGQGVYVGEQQIGEVTSGTFSPTLQQSIAFARLDKTHKGQCDVKIRDKRIAASIVRLPFVKNGQPAILPL